MLVLALSLQLLRVCCNGPVVSFGEMHTGLRQLADQISGAYPTFDFYISAIICMVTLCIDFLWCRALKSTKPALVAGVGFEPTTSRL